MSRDNSENYNESINNYEIALKLNPNNILALNSSARLYYLLGLFQKARENIMKVKILDPDSWNFEINGLTELQDGNFEKVMDIYEEVYSNNPGNFDMVLFKAIALNYYLDGNAKLDDNIKYKKIIQMLAELKRAERFSNNNDLVGVESCYYSGYYNCKLKNYDGAIDELTSCIKYKTTGKANQEIINVKKKAKKLAFEVFKNKRNIMFWDWWLAYPFDSFLLKTIKFFAFGFILILIVIIFCHGIVQSNSEKLLSPSQKVNLYTLTRFRKSRKPWEYYIPDMYRFIIIFLLILILLIPTASKIKMKDFEYEISTPMPETGLTLNLNDIFDKQLKETVSEDIKILPELEENN